MIRQIQLFKFSCNLLIHPWFQEIDLVISYIMGQSLSLHSRYQGILGPCLIPHRLLWCWQLPSLCSRCGMFKPFRSRTKIMNRHNPQGVFNYLSKCWTSKVTLRVPSTSYRCLPSPWDTREPCQGHICSGYIESRFPGMIGQLGRLFQVPTLTLDFICESDTLIVSKPMINRVS